jgi:hypothetical protein
VVREELRIGTLYRKDCCIPATAILCDVLDYFKLPAKPLSVIACIYNPLMTERLEREGMPTREEAERDWFPQGCYSIGVGLGEREPGKWPGHLVALLAGKVLVDLTLDQAERPEHNVILPVPIIAAVGADFLEPGNVARGLVNGCRVDYVARPEDRSFERSNDWKSKKRRDGVVAVCIRRLKKEFHE